MINKKIYKKNFLLTTIIASIVALSIPMSSVSAFTKPLIIDAEIKSPKYGILNLTIEKPDSSSVKIETESCYVNLETNSESFWPIEDLKKVTKRYPRTDFGTLKQGLGGRLSFPCGSTISIKEDSQYIYLNINTHLEPLPEPSKTIIPRVEKQVAILRPVPRPKNLENLINSKVEKNMEEEISKLETKSILGENSSSDQNKDQKTTTKENTTDELPELDAKEIESVKTEEVTILNQSGQVKVITDIIEEVTPITIEEKFKLPEPLDLNTYKDDDFIDTKTELTRLYAHDLSKNYNPNEALIEIAQLYLSKQMGYEGLSILKGLDHDNISEELKLKAQTMKDILELIEYENFNFSDSKIVGNENFKEWEDYSVWTSFAHIKDQNWDSTRDLIDDASIKIVGYPEKFKKILLPALLEAAVETGKWNAAKNLSIEWDKIPDSIETSSFQFLIGQAALKSNRVTDAFDAFSKASLADDLYAHRAKMAIVDLGLATETMPLQDAKVFLEEIRYDWRGDIWEIEALQRLINVHIQLNDEMSALLTLGDAIRRFPDKSKENKMTEQAYTLIESVYERGQNGEIPIDQFFDNHKILKNSFDYLPNYNKYVELYADRLMDIGATLAAVKEYQNLQDNLSLLNEFDVESIDIERIEGLKLKEAQAQLKGARYEEAKSALERFNIENAPNLSSDYYNLKTQVFNLIGDKDSLNEFGLKSESYESLKVMADKAYEEEEWKESYELYESIRSVHPENFNSSIALRMIISAYKNSDDASVLELLSSYPELMENDEWIEIGKDLTKSPSDISKMDNRNTNERIKSSDETINKLEGILNN